MKLPSPRRSTGTGTVADAASDRAEKAGAAVNEPRAATGAIPAVNETRPAWDRTANSIHRVGEGRVAANEINGPHAATISVNETRPATNRTANSIHAARGATRRWWVRTRHCSLLLRPRNLITGVVLLLCALFLGVMALRIGAMDLGWKQVLDVLAGGGDRGTRLVLLQWRLPRIVLALSAGAALGLAGHVFQVITANPLGSPDLIGFTMGAQTGILVSVLLLPASVLSVSSAALLGGVAVGSLIYLLSFRGGFTGLRLILAGIAISSMLASFNRWLLLHADEDLAFGATRAITGTLAAARWSVVLPAAVGIALTTIAVLLLARHLRIMPLGADMTTALGSPTGRIRGLLVLLGTILIALVTMSAGPIGFVALVAPHLARALTGGPETHVLVSGAMGALLLIASDVGSQLFLESMPVGVSTSALGGAYLIALLAADAFRGRRV
ncbi:MAG: iron ABC transporter permease [Actinomycetaceae bacterium]|nr:iron ABC transporter permease [Actinomycetaceae bacterium]